MGRHGSVEARARRPGLRRGAAGTPQLAGGASHARHDPSHHASEVRGPREVVRRRSRQQLGRGRHALGRPRFCGLRRRTRIRHLILDRGDELDTSHAVDCRVVHLENDAEAPLRDTFDAVEPFDHVHLPQRTREIERARVQPRRLDAELPPVPRLRQRDVAHVVLEVELSVLDPVRMVEIERHAHQSSSEHVRQVQPLLDVLEDPLEGDLALRSRRLVVDQDARHVRRRVGRLAVHERGVESAQLLHGDLLSFLLGDTTTPRTYPPQAMRDFSDAAPRQRPPRPDRPPRRRVR